MALIVVIVADRSRAGARALRVIERVLRQPRRGAAPEYVDRQLGALGEARGHRGKRDGLAHGVTIAAAAHAPDECAVVMDGLAAVDRQVLPGAHGQRAQPPLWRLSLRRGQGAAAV